MTLPPLPLEIHALIIQYASFPDLPWLCLVSSSFYALAGARLYHTLTNPFHPLVTIALHREDNTSPAASPLPCRVNPAWVHEILITQIGNDMQELIAGLLVTVAPKLTSCRSFHWEPCYTRPRNCTALVLPPHVKTVNIADIRRLPDPMPALMELRLVWPGADQQNIHAAELWQGLAACAEGLRVLGVGCRLGWGWSRLDLTAVGNKVDIPYPQFFMSNLRELLVVNYMSFEWRELLFAGVPWGRLEKLTCLEPARIISGPIISAMPVGANLRGLRVLRVSLPVGDALKLISLCEGGRLEEITVLWRSEGVEVLGDFSRFDYKIVDAIVKAAGASARVVRIHGESQCTSAGALEHLISECPAITELSINIDSHEWEPICVSLVKLEHLEHLTVGPLDNGGFDPLALLPHPSLRALHSDLCRRDGHCKCLGDNLFTSALRRLLSISTSHTPWRKYSALKMVRLYRGNLGRGGFPIPTSENIFLLRELKGGSAVQLEQLNTGGLVGEWDMVASPGSRYLFSQGDVTIDVLVGRKEDADTMCGTAQGYDDRAGGWLGGRWGGAWVKTFCLDQDETLVRAMKHL